MHRDGASTAGGGKMTMQFFPTMPSPGFTCSPTIADFTPPLPYSSIFFASSTSDQPTTSTTTIPGPATTPTSVPKITTTDDLSILMLEHQDLLSRHKNCLTQLEKTFNEAETLRQENTNLRVANRDLNNHLNLIVQAYLQNHYDSMMSSNSSFPSPEQFSSAPRSSITEKFGGLLLTESQRDAARWEDCESPTSVIQGDRTAKVVDRVSLPKSISVRASGIPKAGQATPAETTSAPPSRGSHRNRSVAPVDGPKKVYVRGGNKKDGPIELEVYNQGMSKTELCNKWQETGSCPYGEHCQFAHGIEELRPVLRHPRYKTEVCRMVLTGDTCPYGHRCHFRHALTEQEKLMVPLKLD